MPTARRPVLGWPMSISPVDRSTYAARIRTVRAFRSRSQRPECRRLAPAEAGEGSEQRQDVEPTIMGAIGAPIPGHRPPGPLGLGPCGIDLWRWTHLAATAEAKPVATRDFANVADRAAAHLLGQREDLGDGNDRPLARTLGACAADSARVAGEELVFLDCGHQDGAEQRVRLRRYRPSQRSSTSWPPSGEAGRANAAGGH